MLYTWIVFDGDGKLDTDGLKREAANVLGLLLAQGKSRDRNTNWRPKKSLESLAEGCCRGPICIHCSTWD